MTTIRTTAFGLLILALTHSWAAPNTIRFQGRLTDAQGKPIAGDDVQVRFSLFNTATGGSLLWQGPADQTVATNDAGLFSTDLGPLPADIVANNADLFLQINVFDGTGFRSLSPRQKLGTVPYAMHSEYSAVSGSSTVVGDNSVGANQLKMGSVTAEKLSPSIKESLIPQGMLAMFAGSCPAGWSFFAPLVGRLPMGIGEFAYTGAPGGDWAITGSSIAQAGSHSHVTDSHSHPIPHKHTVPIGHAGGGTVVIPTVGAWAQGTETVTALYSYFAQDGANQVSFPFMKSKLPDTENSGSTSVNTDVQGQHSHGISFDGQWRPPHVGVVFCMKE